MNENLGEAIIDFIIAHFILLFLIAVKVAYPEVKGGIIMILSAFVLVVLGIIKLQHLAK